MQQDATAPLKKWRQWVTWRLEEKTGANGVKSLAKVPYSPVTGYGASTRDPKAWATYDEAEAYARKHGMAGVGFVFTEADPFFFLDIDKALINGQWSQLAQQLCARLGGSFVEVSQSGTGLHLIGSTGGQLPPHKNKNIGHGIELYTRWRFVALTGLHARGDMESSHGAALASIIEEYFNPASVEGGPAEWSNEPAPEWSGPESDDELLKRAFAAKPSAAAQFGGGCTFYETFTADAKALANKFPPSQPGQDFDHSSADLSLANHLAFWTGRNCERIERLMRKSDLARDKWDERPDWLEETILKAAGMVRTVYNDRYKKDGTTKPAPKEKPAPRLAELETEAASEAPEIDDVSAADAFTAQEARQETVPNAAEPKKRTTLIPRAGGLLIESGQRKLFEGCVYVINPHRVVNPEGRRLNQSQFDVLYGGYSFMMDPDGEKVQPSAWKCFTESQMFSCTKVDDYCFRPEHPPGAIVDDAGLMLINTYVPAAVRRTPGDVSLYLDLLERQLPNERDREIFLTYMSSVVRNPGMKAQWWPVIQGGQGNGKTVHLNCMRYAVGPRYCHLVNTDKMTRGQSNFNAWVDGRLFVGLEEVYATDRRQFFESFKTTVTNSYLPVEKKGVDEATMDNRCNGMITTNHKDGVPLGAKDRRYCIFFMAQQTLEDVQKDGLTAEYFMRLRHWLTGTGEWARMGTDYGYSCVAHYLMHRPITHPEFDPAQLAGVAPETSAKAEAITVSLGRVEQEVLEGLEDGTLGYNGDWLSSHGLQDFLKERGLSRHLPTNKRRDMLRSLGFDYHPALSASEGRACRNVPPLNKKPRIYCRMNSEAFSTIYSAQEACDAFVAAQVAAMSQETAAAFSG